MNDSAARKAFFAQFRRHGALVQRARLFASALFGLGVGACSVALLSALRHWRFAELSLRDFALASGALLSTGLVLGIAHAVARRFSDEQLASYLDERLASEEAISAALLPERDSRWLDSVYERATSKLSATSSSRPRILGFRHLTMVLGPLLALPWLWLEPRSSSEKPPPTGSELARLDTLDGLLALERLEGIGPLDPETQRKLDALRAQARQLDESLKNGMERRNAQASIAQLRDQVQALSGELVSGRNQAGLAAAVEELRKEAALRLAADALSAGDVVRFDREMRKLATQLEQESRERARSALERARRAASAKGSRALSSALGEQQRRFEEREQASRWLRQLAAGLPDETGRTLSQALEQLSDDRLNRQALAAVEEVLRSLTEEQQRALGEHLRKAIEHGELGDAPLEQQQLQELARQLEQGTAHYELQRLLEQLSEHGATSRMLQGLEQAENGLSRAERKLRGILPVPQSTPQTAEGSSEGAPSDPSSQGGPGTGPGLGAHAGKTEALAAPELRALARPRLDTDLPLMGATRGRSPARPGEVSNLPLGSDLSGVTADELRGVEHSNIPEEYREQVSRYFAQ